MEPSGADELRILMAVGDTEELGEAARFAVSTFGDDAYYSVVMAAQRPAHSAADGEPPSGDRVYRVAPGARVVAGEAGAEICRIAADESFDLIVVGSPERSRSASGDSRSVRDYLVDNAPCPVVIVR